MRARVLLAFFVASLVAAGCAANGDTPPPSDAGPRVDGGGTDSGRADGAVARDDSGTTCPAGCRRICEGGLCDCSCEDAGTAAAVVIDGTLGAEEWAGAASATNTVASSWGANTLARVVARADAARLYVGVEGQVEAMNAIVMYVDGALGAGTGIADLATLTDADGELDNAISAGIAVSVPGFGADLAWGTRDMARAASGFDGRMGWRNIVTMPGDFAWISADDGPAACSATACETSIPLAMLAGGGSRTIALFVRIVNGDGFSISNQCLPEDDETQPQTVSVLLELAL